MTAQTKSLEQNSSTPQHKSLLQTLLQDDLNAVNKVIMDYMQSPVDLIPVLAGHLIAAGGKRIRPLLTLACSRMCEYKGQDHIHLAACVEFIHTATLLHDDVVDESELRRGNSTANNIWGNQASVLVGDFLFSRSFQLMVKQGSLEVLKTLSEASATISEGEVMQLEAINNLNISEEKYLNIIQSKTAALFQAACKIGGILTQMDDKSQQALIDFGNNLGIVFQLIDDMLDYSADQEHLGKSVGDDFREGKVTLPIVIAYEKANDEEKEFWHKTLENLEQNEGAFNQAREYLIKHNAIEKTYEQAQSYAQKALDALDILPSNEYNTALKETVQFCLDRAY